MKRSIIKHIALAAALIMTVTSAGCAGKNGSSLRDENSPNENTSSQNGDVNEVTGEVQPVVSDKVKDKDLDESFDDPTAQIALGESIEILGSGAAESGGVITISQEGVYVFSGAVDDGEIIVAADEKADVKIVLSGADITNTKGAAIYAQSADKVIITLAPDTENSLADGGSDTADACIYAECDLTVNGSGKLSVNGNVNDGIVIKDDIILVNGDVDVNAVSTGIKGKDSVTMYGGKYSVTSGGDSVKSTTADDSAKGWIVVSGGELELVGGRDGIQAETSLDISGGSIRVKTDSSLSQDGEEAGKGLKAGAQMLISGGDIDISSADHGIHCDGALTVDGGAINISSSDGDGISVGGELTVSGGSITVENCDEGMESKANISISGGEINITANDDGFNTAVSDTAPQAAHDVSISGGNIRIDSGGDGIDAYGNISVTGGVVTVFGPVSSGDSPLDCGDMGSSIAVNGGTVIAAGSVAMLQLPDEAASQYSIYTTMLNASAGDTVTLADGSGNVIASFTAPKQLEGVTISSPDIKSGETYHLYMGGKLEADENGEAFRIDTDGAEEIASGEVSQVNTSFGGSVQGGFGGFGGRPDDGQRPDGGFGGMGERRDPPQMPQGVAPPEI